MTLENKKRRYIKNALEDHEKNSDSDYIKIQTYKKIR